MKDAWITSGRTADIFALDEHRVLRRYRDGGDVVAEAAVMAHVRAHGYPVPVVYEAGGTDMILERLTGPTMLRALVAGDLAIDAAARILADLHAALHAIPARASPAGAEERACEPRRPGQASPAGADRVLHLDLHPDNVVLDPRGPVVIDWRNTAEGPPDFDVAQTGMILAEVAVDPTHALAAQADRLLTAFLRYAGWRPPGMLDRAQAYRRSDPALTAAEIGRLADAAARVTAAAP
jgi:aminoglycoside phosphotransferase (APT) family kinase protein